MAQALAPGQVLAGRYEIEKTLGQGGFGITYAAMDKKLLGRVAVKEYFPASLAVRQGERVKAHGADLEARFEKGRRRFMEEAKTLAGLSQTAGIVRVLGCFEERGTAYMVMEYVQGRSLRCWLEEQETLPAFYEAAKLLEPVCRALEQVHKKGLIHRDICPDNLIMRDNGTLTLIDFGAARAYYRQEEEVLTRTVLVHQGYAPPEQYESKGKQGPWTDVYGLAATLYEMVTGAMPPSAPQRLGGEKLYPPSAYGADITAEQEEALLRGLKLEVRERFASVKAFEGALLPAKENESDRKKGRPLLWVLAGGAMLGLGLILLCLFAGKKEKPLILAGNYVRGSQEYEAFLDFVKANAVEVQEREEGVMYVLEEEAIRTWGAPANRYAMPFGREEAGQLLEKMGLTEDTEGGWDIFWVWDKGYGAISTRFDRVQVYKGEDGLQVLVCADIISGQVNLIELSDGTREAKTAMAAAAELCAGLEGAWLSSEEALAELEEAMETYFSMEGGYAGLTLEDFEMWITEGETGTKITLGRYGSRSIFASDSYWPDGQ